MKNLLKMSGAIGMVVLLAWEVALSVSALGIAIMASLFVGMIAVPFLIFWLAAPTKMKLTSGVVLALSCVAVYALGRYIGLDLLVGLGLTSDVLQPPYCHILYLATGLVIVLMLCWTCMAYAIVDEQSSIPDRWHMAATVLTSLAIVITLPVVGDYLYSLI